MKISGTNYPYMKQEQQKYNEQGRKTLLRKTGSMLVWNGRNGLHFKENPVPFYTLYVH